MSVSELIAQAAESCGSESELARRAGFSQNAVWAARRAGRVSADLAVGIEKATDGKFLRWQFRPDLWPAPADETHAGEVAA